MTYNMTPRRFTVLCAIAFTDDVKTSMEIVRVRGQYTQMRRYSYYGVDVTEITRGLIRQRYVTGLIMLRVTLTGITRLLRGRGDVEMDARTIPYRNRHSRQRVSKSRPLTLPQPRGTMGIPSKETQNAQMG